MLGLLAVCRLSLVVESGSYSPLAMHGRLIAVTPLVVEHELQGTRAHGSGART